MHINKHFDMLSIFTIVSGGGLKGQCHEIFCFRFFQEFFRKFAEIFASQGVPPVSTTPVANCRRYQRHRWQICHRYQQHRRQILPPVPLVLLTPVANNGNNIRLQTPESELEGKNLYLCFLYYPKVTKQNY
jgi:hypothetical protein